MIATCFQSPPDKSIDINIVVVTNGVLEKTVKLDWVGFAEINKIGNGKKKWCEQYYSAIRECCEKKMRFHFIILLNESVAV